MATCTDQAFALFPMLIQCSIVIIAGNLVSVRYCLLPAFIVAHRNMKSWEEPGDKASARVGQCTIMTRSIDYVMQVNIGY